jgi:ribosomal protein L11 methyltransferase
MGHAFEVQLEAPESFSDALQGFLYLEGVDEIVVEDEITGPVEGHPPLPAGIVRLSSYFIEEPDAEFETRARGYCETVLVRRGSIDPDLYRDRWKAFFKPAKVSSRIWIKPSWEELPEPPAANDIIIVIDPGAAFGTGLHETTKLCLQALDESLQPKQTMLDVGTGSGILAIAASLLGASVVKGIDTDPLSVTTAIENFERNKLSNASASNEFVDDLTETYDVVVANILAAVLVTLRAELWQRVAPGGLLVLSGLLATELEFVKEKFIEARPGSRCVGSHQMGEWGSLRFTD